MEQIYIRTAQRLLGPLKDSEFKRLIRNGQISLQDQIWHFYQNVWVKLEQIEKIRRFFEEELRRTKAGQIIAVGGSKGGVGKTSLVAAMALELSKKGKSVIAVDADFQDPDLHKWLGVANPRTNLRHFFNRQGNELRDVVTHTPFKNLQLICGPEGNIEACNPLAFQRAMFAQQLFELRADFVILDLGPGASFANVDLFLACDRGIVVIEPEPSAILSAFRFIRIAFLQLLKRLLVFSPPSLELIRRFGTSELQHPYSSIKPLLAKIDRIDVRASSLCKQALDSFKPDIVMNKVISKTEVQEGVMLVHALNELLGINATYLGFIEYNSRFRQAAKAGKPVILDVAKKSASPAGKGKDAKGHLFKWFRRAHRPFLEEANGENVEDNVVQSVFGSFVDNWPTNSNLERSLLRRIESYFS